MDLLYGHILGSDKAVLRARTGDDDDRGHFELTKGLEEIDGSTGVRIHGLPGPNHRHGRKALRREMKNALGTERIQKPLQSVCIANVGNLERRASPVLLRRMDVRPEY